MAERTNIMTQKQRDYLIIIAGTVVLDVMLFVVGYVIGKAIL